MVAEQGCRIQSKHTKINCIFILLEIKNTVQITVTPKK